MDNFPVPSESISSNENCKWEKLKTVVLHKEIGNGGKFFGEDVDFICTRIVEVKRYLFVFGFDLLKNWEKKLFF